MAGRKIPDDELKKVLAADIRHKGNELRAAEELGIPRTSYLYQLGVAKTRRVKGTLGPDFEVATLPDLDPPIEELIAFRRKTWERKHAAASARSLINVKVNLDGPIGILHFGDPHVDDDGCNFPQLEADVALVNNTAGLFGGNVGDLHNNWIGRLGALYGNQNTTARQAWKLVEWLVTSVDWMYLVLGNHDCLDMETECLTERGWVSGDEVRDDDFVLSFDTKTECATWSPVQARVLRPHKGKMINVETRSTSMCMTPNHRVLHKQFDRETYGWKGWEFATAEKMPDRLAVPVSGSSENAGVSLSDEQIGLAGWLLTDGGITWHGNSPCVTIYQSKDGTEIERLLTSLNLKHRKYVRQRNITSVCGRVLVSTPLPQQEWKLTADASREVLTWCPEKGVLPDWSIGLSDRQFSVLLDAIVAGDGTWDGSAPEEKKCAVVHGTKEFLSSLQMAAVQHGWRARISVARGKDYRLNLAKSEKYSLWSKAATKEIDYDGNVWCLTVPLSNFMVRRNGAAYFTGNCWSGNGDPLDFIKHGGIGVMEPHGARLNLSFPNGKQVRINARHDFTGRSMWNPNHGPVKAIQAGWRDHILTCGHTHSTGLGPPLKDPATGLISWPIRCAGYKVHDEYADKLGLPSQNISPSILTVIDPRYEDDDPRLITPFLSAEEGADFLVWKRKKAGAETTVRKRG